MRYFKDKLTRVEKKPKQMWKIQNEVIGRSSNIKKYY